MSISYIFIWFWLFLLSLFNIKEFENKEIKEFDDEKDLRVRKVFKDLDKNKVPL